MNDAIARKMKTVDRQDWNASSEGNQWSGMMDDTCLVSILK